MSLPPEWFEEQPKGGRGRPFTSWATSRAFRIAREVADVQARLGNKRGAQAEAIRLVAAKRRMSVEGVKKAVKRTPISKKWAPFMLTVSSNIAEIDRRTAGFPDTVRDYLFTLPPVRLLELLRQHNVNGECPQWLLTAYFDAKEKS